MSQIPVEFLNKMAVKAFGYCSAAGVLTADLYKEILKPFFLKRVTPITDFAPVDEKVSVGILIGIVAGYCIILFIHTSKKKISETPETRKLDVAPQQETNYGPVPVRNLIFGFDRKSFFTMLIVLTCFVYVIAVGKNNLLAPVINSGGNTTINNNYIINTPTENTDKKSNSNSAANSVNRTIEPVVTKPAEPVKYNTISENLLFGTAFTNDKTGVSITISEINSFGKGKGVVTLPDTEEPIQSERLAAGNQWKFKYGKKIYRLTIININPAQGTYQVQVLEN